jgi:hypothetical protein
VRITPFSKNRELIGDQLERARDHHLCVSASYEFDVTEVLPVLDAAKAQGLPVSFITAFVWATGQLLRAQPRLNRHCFQGLFRRYEVDFEEVSCTLVVARQSDQGEPILLPLLVRNIDRMSLVDVGKAIAFAKTAPLHELPQFAALERLKKAPLLFLRWFSYKARTDPHFYIKYFGTYGVSSNLAKGFGPSAAHTLGNTGVSFLPGSLRELPRVVRGQVVPRWILSVLLLVDHYVIDGADMAMAMNGLRALIESPEGMAKALGHRGTVGATG